jgi:rSAM/selenodomain-associated transferase 1
MSRRRLPALVLFAKAPAAGRVKTRLAPDLPPEAAAELQEALLRDTAEVALAAASAATPTPRLWCAVAESADEPPLRRLLPREFALLPQGAGDLGERLERVFGELLRHHACALAIGADCPDLAPGLLQEALEALVLSEAVLGPAQDGGYWAIGLAEPRPALFRGVPWSTERVAGETRRRMAELGLRVAELPVLRDVDRFGDLVEWARRPNACFTRTLAWCRERGLA